MPGGVREIPLTKGQVALVDEADYAGLAARKWYALRASVSFERWYAVRDERRNGVRVCVYMHREIAGAADGEQVDHRDRDGLNNTRANLRRCTNRQNQANAVRRNRSGYRGVVKVGRRWRAQFGCSGANYHLGYYDTPESAARAYDARALVEFGEFARLNFPDDHRIEHRLSIPLLTSGEGQDEGEGY